MTSLLEKLIAEVQEEKEKVVVGGVKMEGKWLSSDEAKANSYLGVAYVNRKVGMVRSNWELAHGFFSRAQVTEGIAALLR
mgnify:CR=1 FL=1